MSLFDSIIGTVGEKSGLDSSKAGGLLAALLGLITSNGFRGFLDRFRSAGLGDTVDSWITRGGNTPISGEQLESALGEDTIASLANETGIDRATATSALAAMTPQVVDRLTPDGELPDESSVRSKIGGYLSNPGGAAVAASGAVTDRVTGAIGNIADNFDDDETENDSVLKWLLPLLLLVMLLVLGFWFCSKAPPATTPAPNTNVNRTNSSAAAAADTNAAVKTADPSFSINAENGKYTVSGVVPDETTRKQIMDALAAQYGAENVDFKGLRVDASARPFATGWWDNFAKMLPSLKDWQTGSLSFTGNAVTEAAGLPAAALDQLKSLFAGWKLPVSIAGAETAVRQANEEALKELEAADSIDEVVRALNVSIINFASGSAAVPADAKPILEKAAEVLKKQPAGATVEIGGHTDSDGNDDANMKLSQARADSVRKELIALGVSDSMLTAKGYGETAAVAPNDTPDNKFKNRRIEYKTGTGGAPTATATIAANTNSAAPNANSAK